MTLPFWGCAFAGAIALSYCAFAPLPAQSPLEQPSATPVANADEVDYRLPVAGFDDPQAMRDFLDRLRAAAAGGDRPTLLEAVQYPFTLYQSGTAQATYASSEDLARDFDAVFTPAVLEVLRTARYEELFVIADGAMLGNGEVWLMPTDSGIAIRAINP